MNLGYVPNTNMVTGHIKMFWFKPSLLLLMSPIHAMLTTTMPKIFVLFIQFLKGMHCMYAVL